MFFGVRAGPFRIGTSGKGRVFGGVSAGPFSVGGPLSGGRSERISENAVIMSYGLDDLVAGYARDGWKVGMYTPGESALLEKGWDGIGLAATPRGTLVRKLRSDRYGIAVTFLVVAAVAVLCGGPLLISRFG